MTPAIPLDNLTDRELLILAVQSMNTLAERQGIHDKVIFGNGWPGLKAQVFWLWLLVGGVWAAALAILSSGTLQAFVGKQ